MLKVIEIWTVHCASRTKRRNAASELDSNKNKSVSELQTRHRVGVGKLVGFDAQLFLCLLLGGSDHGTTNVA